MQAEMKSGAVQLRGNLYLVRKSSIRKADKTVELGEKVLRFSNPRACVLAGKKVLGRGFDQDKMDELGDAIVKQYLNHPLVVRPMKGDHFCTDIESAEWFEVVEGERRFRRICLAVEENMPCMSSDGTIIPAAECYESIECRVKVLNDLEAYNYALTASGVPLSDGAITHHVRYLKDNGVDDAEILKMFGKKHRKWLDNELAVSEHLGNDEKLWAAYITGELDRGGAFYYAGIADVAKRHAEFDKAHVKAAEQHAKHQATQEHLLHGAEMDLDRKESDRLIAEHTGEDVDEATAAVEVAEQKVRKRKKKVTEAAEAPVVVTRRHIDRNPDGGGSTGSGKPKGITRRAMQEHWIVPLEQLVHEGTSEEVDLEDAQFVLHLWKLMNENHRDIVGALKERGRHHTCPHTANHNGKAKCRAEALATV